VLRRLLAGDTVTHAGTYCAVDRCRIDPPASRAGGPLLMVGSNSPRMLSIALPHVHAWNVWWSIYGNTPAGCATVVGDVRRRTEELGRDPDDVEATVCVYVRTPGGVGRTTMGDLASQGVAPVTGSLAEVADTLAAFADAGAEHLQLVVDPITEPAIEWLGGVLEQLGSRP